MYISSTQCRKVVDLVSIFTYYLITEKGVFFYKNKIEFPLPKSSFEIGPVILEEKIL